MVEALLSAAERGLCNMAAIHQALGFDEAQAAEAVEFQE
jgi:hypothetical protein